METLADILQGWNPAATGLPPMGAMPAAAPQVMPTEPQPNVGFREFLAQHPEPAQSPTPAQSPAATTPQSRGGFEDPNRWLITAAALASGPRALQLLPLAHMAYGELTKSQEEERVAAEKEAARKQSETTALVDLRGAQSAESMQRTSESKQKLPGELEQTRLGNLEKQQRVESAELAYKQAKRLYEAKLKLDPTGATEAKLEMDTAKAKLDAEKALTGQRQAAAGESSARAAQTKAETKAMETLGSTTATEEEKTRARTELQAATALLQYAGDDTREGAEATLKAIMTRSVKAGTPPNTPKVITEADIQSNMTKYKKTREEVLAAAKAQGYQLQGK